MDILKRMEEELPVDPYSEQIWNMTEEQYREYVSNPHLRASISGMLMRIFYARWRTEFLNTLKKVIEDE